MADRSAAGIFGDVFALLASKKSKEEIARAVWRLSFSYDFSRRQMEAERALKKLGLARDATYEEEVTYTDGTREWETIRTTQYRGRNGRSWDEVG